MLKFNRNRTHLKMHRKEEKRMSDISDPSGTLISVTVEKLFTDKILQKATELAQRYDACTDSIVMYRALVEIKRMLLNIDRYNLRYNDPRLQLIIEDFAARVKRINSIIVGSRKNYEFVATEKDWEMWNQIQTMCQRIGAKAKTPVSLDKITPFLIEASHELKNEK